MRSFLILVILFYILTGLQTSFLVRFSIKGYLANLILIAVLFLNLLESPQKNNGILAGFLGGFFWDIFSSVFIGFHVLILVTTAIFIKWVLGKYIRTPQC